MARDGFLFARLALDYADHPKIADLSDAAFRAHITMILYARKYETDGVIKNRVANRLASQWDTDVLAELQSNDENNPSLVRMMNGDYMLHDYSELQETKAEIAARKRRNSANGAKGGRPKTESVSESVTGSGGDSLTHSQTHRGTQKKAETETETETEERKKNTQKKRPSYSDDFEAFWSIYPRKDDKRRAAQAFKSAIGRADLDVILAGATRYRDDPNRTMTKMPTTWLNADAWDNGPIPPSHRVPPPQSRPNTHEAWSTPAGEQLPSELPTFDDVIEGEVLPFRRGIS